MPVFCWVNYNLAASVPLTATPNRESRGTRPPCESRAAPSSPSGETSARSAATLRAGAQSKRPKSAKGVWGKTRVFPHKQHIKSSRDYPPKQSGGLFRKHTTQLNYSFLSQAAFRLQTPIYLTIHRPNFYSLELLKNSQHHRINHKARCKLPMKRSDHHADQN